MAENRNQPQFERKRMELAYEIFQLFALEDQQAYYDYSVKKNRKAATQINRWRAFFALMTGLVSALAGLLVATNDRTCFSLEALSAISVPAQSAAPAPIPQEAAEQEQANCGPITGFVAVLMFIAVIAPVAGAGFNALSDLYQWDRLITVYESALENIQVADAKSPLPSMRNTLYWASLQAYATGTLSVMRDETSQWGQLIKTPEQLQSFIDRQVAEAQQAIPGKDEAKNWARPNPSEPATPAPPPPEPPLTPDGGQG